MPILLLCLFGAAAIIGAGFTLLIIRLARRKPAVSEPAFDSPAAFPYGCGGFAAPARLWLVVKSSNARSVQSALGLHHPTPCSWSEGLTGEKKAVHRAAASRLDPDNRFGLA